MHFKNEVFISSGSKVMTKGEVDKGKLLLMQSVAAMQKWHTMSESVI